MKTRLAMFALFAVASAATDPCIAQSVPEGQSCGGLFCDLGIVGHKTAPSPGGNPATPPAAPPPAATPPAVVLSDPAAEPRKPVVHKKRRIAKAVAARAPAAAVVARAPATPETATAVKPSAAAAPVPTTPVPPPASAGPSILNPFASPQHSPFNFKPIY